MSPSRNRTTSTPADVARRAVRPGPAVGPPEHRAVACDDLLLGREGRVRGVREHLGPHGPDGIGSLVADTVRRRPGGLEDAVRRHLEQGGVHVTVPEGAQEAGGAGMVGPHSESRPKVASRSPWEPPCEMARGATAPGCGRSPRARRTSRRPPPPAPGRAAGPCPIAADRSQEWMRWSAASCQTYSATSVSPKESGHGAALRAAVRRRTWWPPSPRRSTWRPARRRAGRRPGGSPPPRSCCPPRGRRSTGPRDVTWLTRSRTLHSLQGVGESHWSSPTAFDDVGPALDRAVVQGVEVHQIAPLSVLVRVAWTHQSRSALSRARVAGSGCSTRVEGLVPPQPDHGRQQPEVHGPVVARRAGRRAVPADQVLPRRRRRRRRTPRRTWRRRGRPGPAVAIAQSMRTRSSPSNAMLTVARSPWARRRRRSLHGGDERCRGRRAARARGSATSPGTTSANSSHPRRASRISSTSATLGLPDPPRGEQGQDEVERSQVRWRLAEEGAVQ